MATVDIKVPLSEKLSAREGWIENVSQHIDAGNDVEFVNMNDGADVNISSIQVDTEGAVCIWGAGYTASDAKAMTLIAGGWHVFHGIHGIRADGTDSSIGIHVKI